VNVDPNRIRQVFANLLDNAIKYTSAGGSVTITVRDEPGQAVAMFRDTGVGIPAEEQEKFGPVFIAATRAVRNVVWVWV